MTIQEKTLAGCLVLVDHDSRYEYCIVELKQEGTKRFSLNTTYYSKVDRFSPGGTVSTPAELPERWFEEGSVEVREIFRYLDRYYRIMRGSYADLPDEKYCMNWEKRYDLNRMRFL